MANENEPELKDGFSDTKTAETKPKQYSRKTKIIAIAVLIVLLLGSVVSVALMLRRAKPIRLTEVNLEEGETLTYRVHQDIKINVGDVKKGMSSFANLLQNIKARFIPQLKKPPFSRSNYVIS